MNGYDGDENKEVAFNKDKLLLMLDIFDFVKDKDIKDVKQKIEEIDSDKIGASDLEALKGQKIKPANTGWTPPGVVA